MKKFTEITSTIIPLPIKDIDTDMLIPAQRLTSISKDGYGEFLFERFRSEDKNFPLNLPQYKGAKIIVADTNFGCGSSREHAVWALLDYGIEVIIAPSFSDIFFNNSMKNGLVLVTLDKSLTDSILSSANQDNSKDNLVANVNLSTKCVTIGDAKYAFNFDPFYQHCIMNGQDDLDYILHAISAKG